MREIETQAERREKRQICHRDKKEGREQRWEKRGQDGDQPTIIETYIHRTK